MSSFRFNFSGNEASVPQLAITEEIKWLESEEVVPDKQIDKLDDIVVHAKMFTCGEIEIGHVVANDEMLSMGDSNVSDPKVTNETLHSDLVTGKYEGGLKIWECTRDLIEYLSENEAEIKLDSAKVLDLGCGAGILGIYTLMNGSQVSFQDYNREVLECVTIPSVLLNVEEEDRETEIKKCRFYSGDWASFNTKLAESEVFDIILTSETIYNPSNYDKLIELFVQKLSKDGVVYVAAKTCYFGVGGGTRQFEAIVEKCKYLQSEVCWKSSGGIQREILKIYRLL